MFEKFKVFENDIIILSLKNSIDRRNNINKNIKKFKFFDAIDGKNIDKNILKKYKNRIDYTKLNSGQIGCFISHLLIWDSIKNKNTPTIILEDDSKILNYSFEINDSIFKNIENYDIIFLGHCGESKGKYLEDNIYESVYPRCTHGYIVSKKGVNKLIDLFENEKIDFPIDEKIGNIIYNKKLISYTVEPQIIIQDNFKSTIN
jgi:GR25 family glycosyltransferase involved in LPS biosynthesis